MRFEWFGNERFVQHAIRMVLQCESNSFATLFEWFCNATVDRMVLQHRSNAFAMLIKWFWATTIQSSQFMASMFQVTSATWVKYQEQKEWGDSEEVNIVTLR